MPSEVERVRDELAAATATSRRSVGEVLRRLGPWVELDRPGDRARARAPAVTALAAAFQAGRAPAPTAEEPLAAAMAAIMDGLPAPVRHLDHVPATPATAARRARFLAETFDLDRASVLCLGDHDLTSLALLQVAPGAEVAVVDVDERVLAYVDAVARERGWRVRTVFADLRVELPRSLAERFDLVFSDPPYTQPGVRLFLRRGLEALGRGEFARLLFCYGFGERQPALRTAAAADPRIYTHGEGAEEAALPPAAVRTLEGLAGDRGELDLTVVGDGLPEGLGGRGALPLGAYLREVGAPLARLLGSTWRLRVHARGGRSTPAVLVAERTEPPAGDAVGFVLRYLVDHCHAVLGNAWREALIARAAADGRRVSKNQARHAIAAGPLAGQLQSHLAELPVELLRLLVADVGRTLEEPPAAPAGA
jgi:hypothetical protein